MAIQAETGFSLKDHLFNEATVAELAGALASADSALDARAFQDEVNARLGEHELKARIRFIASVLERYLPQDYDGALAVLQGALPPPLDPALTDGDFGHYIWAVPAEFVARHGCTRERLERSLDFLREATMRFSAENAIRPFLQQFPQETLRFVAACARDDNYHVRRLASEGIRPLLPWAPRVDLPLDDIVPILDVLHADPTRYVTRSVANCLNDVAKIEPERVIATLGRWREARRQRPSELAWMTAHALRTLVREDNVEALSLLGYAVPPKIRVTRISSTRRVSVGEAFTWRCTLESLARQRVIASLKIYFLKANGTQSAKVFALGKATLAKGETLALKKRHPFRPLTTRTLYPGEHAAELVVNGTVLARRTFEVGA